MTAEPQPLAERTKTYALRVIRLYGALPKTTVAQVIGRQLLHSGTSVGANYREGRRVRSSAEMATKFDVCVQELAESSYLIELLADAGILQKPVLDPLLDETDQLIAISTSSIKRISTPPNTDRKE
ncbi:MAG TPA: four helix bundle protein [Roseiflexaceae bacterium]|nr:four helix bundle protein [Roseiflexaceae bacterium]